MSSWDEIKQKFKLKAVRTWHMQPLTGNIPIIGPRPKREWWAPMSGTNGMGMYQLFMSMTLSRFYKSSTPDWAKRAWDIQLTATNATGSSSPYEVNRAVIAKIDPNL